MFVCGYAFRYVNVKVLSLVTFNCYCCCGFKMALRKRDVFVFVFCILPFLTRTAHALNLNVVLD